jgi:hypothetical protein
VYAADGKKESTKQGKLGDALLKATALRTGQSVEVRMACRTMALQHDVTLQQQKQQQDTCASHGSCKLWQGKEWYIAQHSAGNKSSRSYNGL